MIIKDLFAKDIDRSINGVVKVAQDDEASLEQELSEYVVTRELSRHFSDFFESYTDAIDMPTDRIGVWISGFFGSGKSHFLKILSYLLSNRTVAGRKAIDYFEGKIEDELVYSKMKRACEIPTEAILFNIDDKASQWKEGSTAKTALLRAFARVFYEHRGFYGANLNLGRLEEFIDEQGKTDEFRGAFAELTGMEWIECREDSAFYEDDIVDVLQSVLGWSEAQARRQFERVDDEALAPEDLVREISQYVERRSAEEGGRFRLLFMVDEVGQFIGADVNLMLNLQTIVEDLGARCNGKVWVMVTSQEAIDEVTKVASNDFSKIQGRFNTRLSLSSSSVDEVIKRRVLEKNATAEALLETEYEKQSAVLKNLFTFENSRSDYIGYRSARDFRDTYPFVGYQFNLMRDVLKEIRIHGNAGKHLSGGERSMLSGFQESAQAVELCDTRTLVPLWRFYDTLSEFLEHDIRQVIERCQRAAEDAAGIEDEDVAVLKTLYLIHYITDMKSTVGNVAILMIDSIDVDKISLREQVSASLARLARENYISRTGDEYHFLTNAEQDIAREIKNTDIDTAAIIDGIARIVFDDLFTSRKLRVGVNDFPIDTYVDGTLYGSEQGGMKLEIITEANPLSQADDSEIALRSPDKAVVVLADGGDYYDELSNAAKIRKYVRTKNIQSLDLTVRGIIENKNKEAATASKEAGQMIAASIVNARCFVDGVAMDVRAGNAKTKLESVLQSLAKAVYSKAAYIDTPVQGKGDLVKILAGSYQQALPGTDGANQRAIEEVQRYLDTQSYTLQQTSFGDIRRQFQKPPCGWRDIDIAACVARLIADQKAEASRAGQPIDQHDPKLSDYLFSRAEEDKLRIGKREKIDDVLLGRVRKLLRQLPGIDSLPEGEDELMAVAKDWLEARHDECERLLTQEYARQAAYPGRDVVAAGRMLTGDLLQHARNAKALFKALKDSSDKVEDFAEEFESVQGFFPNQQRLFDDALATVDLMNDDKDYLGDDASAMEALSEIQSIIGMERPYRVVSNLPSLVSVIRGVHSDRLGKRKAELLERVEKIKDDVEDYAGKKNAAAFDAPALDTRLLNIRGSVNDAATLTKLAALDQQLDSLRDKQFALIDSLVAKPASSSGNGGEEVPLGVPPVRTVKELRRSDVCPSRVLASEQDIDAYIQEIREQLVKAVKDAGSVKLVG